eukprot:728420-Amphidinium_carterae.1
MQTRSAVGSALLTEHVTCSCSLQFKVKLRLASLKAFKATHVRVIGCYALGCAEFQTLGLKEGRPKNLLTTY